MFVTHERFLNCSTQSSAENAAPAKGVGCCCVVDPEREESWLEGSAGWPVQEDPFRADGRPRLPEPGVARALSDSFGLGAKKLDHPSWETLSQAWGENSCLRFPWLLLLVDWVLDMRKDYGQSQKSKQWQNHHQRGGKTSPYGSNWRWKFLDAKVPANGSLGAAALSESCPLGYFRLAEK